MYTLNAFEPLSPRRVVEEMSFQQQSPTKDKSWKPLAPAPAAPPPPPPPGDSDVESVRSVNLDEDQDTNKYSSYQNSRAAPVPTITNYGVSPAVSPPVEKINPGMRGDPNLCPNTGQTNDDYGGIGSLREVASRLRWMTIASTVLAIIWEGFAFPTRLLVHAWVYPAKVVLGAYLAAFCLLLLGVELNAPLRDNFGVLYYPLGRAALLFLMSGMCFGILAAWWEVLLGLAFFACASGYVFAYIKYPEYRHWQDYNDNEVWKEVKSVMNNGSIAWARPSASDLASGWNAAQQESQSLLHNV
jgi:hypothetical protein